MVAESTTLKRQWTYSELVALDNEVRYELYDGEVVEMASPTLLHQDIIGNLFALLRAWSRQNNTGHVYISPVDLYVSETRCFVPDLCFYRRERYEQEVIERDNRRCLIAPPDLIVEVISPSTAGNDRILKTALYADFGVLHYWMIDPEGKTLQAMVLADGHYRVEGGAMAEGIFEPAAFPGLTIALAELFKP